MELMEGGFMPSFFQFYLKNYFIHIGIVLFLALTGCGGGGGENTSTPGTATPQKQAPVALGLASSYGIIAGPPVTLDGNAAVTGDLAVMGNIYGLPPALIPQYCPLIITGTVSGTIHICDNAAALAQNDMGAALNDAGNRQSGSVEVAGDLATMPSPPFGSNNGVFKPGLYSSQGPLTIGSGETVTLDAAGDSNAVFIFQIKLGTGNTLITGNGSKVVLANGAQAKNVWWVPIGATLGANSFFKGTVLSYIEPVTVLGGTVVEGRIFSLINDVTVNTGSSITVPQ